MRIISALEKMWIRLKINKLLKSYNKLHIGCGNQIYEDWINIDSFTNPLLTSNEKKYIVSKKNFIKFDITELWPFKINTIKYIYSSHLIEHLSYSNSQLFLERCYHTLQKKGVLRITCPDLKFWVAKYLNTDYSFFNALSTHGWPSNIYTSGDFLCYQFYGWDHKWMYDENNIKYLLHKAGFNTIYRKKFNSSVIPDMKFLESKARQFESLYIECIK